jgi:sugar phosphate isomerase/epimerase
VLTDMQTLGCQYVVVPWSGEMYRGSTVQVRELVNLLNSYGQRFADAGLRLAYHNHQFEFAPLDGSTMWELLAAETDPALVDLELDVFWAEVGGFDPIDLIGRYSARLPLLHLKDRAHGPDNTDLPVGAGVLPWERILAAADAAGVQWGIVEQDHPGDPLDDIRRSFHYLQTQCAA